MTLPSDAVKVLQDNQEAAQQFAKDQAASMPPNLTPEEQEVFLARQRAISQNAADNSMAITDYLDHSQQAASKMNNELQQTPVVASVFSLNRYAQLQEQSFGDPQEGINDSVFEENQTFDNEANQEDPTRNFKALDNWLYSQLTSGDDGSLGRVLALLTEQAEDDEAIKTLLSRYKDIIRQEQASGQDFTDQRGKIVMDMRTELGGSEDVFLASGVKEVVSHTTEHIKKLAQDLANHQIRKTEASRSAFNLKKEAQHKALENVVMHGPQGNRIDPFTGQLINDWHIYERNKGWGLRMDDALFVDYEAIWRGNIMDKYSRPYRDDEGNYVGGYIEKRFEVDKWIPEGNNYQLKPGERRKPYLPEYRSTEARLQHMRSTNDVDDREFADTSKPFNWSKQASTNSKKKLTREAKISDWFSSRDRSNNQATNTDDFDMSSVGTMKLPATQNPGFNTGEVVQVQQPGMDSFFGTLISYNLNAGTAQIKVPHEAASQTIDLKYIKKPQKTTVASQDGGLLSNPFKEEKTRSHQGYCSVCGGTAVAGSACPNCGGKVVADPNPKFGPDPKGMGVNKAAQSGTDNFPVPPSMARRVSRQDPYSTLSDPMVDEELDNDELEGMRSAFDGLSGD